MLLQVVELLQFQIVLKLQIVKIVNGLTHVLNVIMVLLIKFKVVILIIKIAINLLMKIVIILKTILLLRIVNCVKKDIF